MSLRASAAPLKPGRVPASQINQEPSWRGKVGDYLLAVNGMPVDTKRDPWAALQGLAEKTVTLTVNDKPSMNGARQVLVKTLASEARLRNLAWIEENRQRVEREDEERLSKENGDERDWWEDDVSDSFDGDAF